jgi:hypothetical protein
MSDETDSKVPLQPVSADDQNDNLAGASVLTLLQRSAYMAEGNSQYAVDIAKDLSRRLVASQARVAELEGRLAELEVEVQVYRDRSEQAEQWLNKISSELQGRVAGKPQWSSLGPWPQGSSISKKIHYEQAALEAGRRPLTGEMHLQKQMK